MIRRLYDQLEEIAGATLLAAMCLAAIAQVTGRYLLASPPAWTEELATLLFAWLVFVGASLALKRNEHFALDVVVALLPGTLRWIVQGLVLALVFLFCVLLVVYGSALAMRGWAVKTAVMEIPRTWLYASVPFGGALMLLRTVGMIIRWRAESIFPTTSHRRDGGR